MIARKFGTRLQGRGAFFALCVMYAVLVAACLGTLVQDDELSLGRNPLANLVKTAGEFAYPSFLDAWYGDPRLQYKSDDGTVLRVENRQVIERAYLSGLASATWDTIRIATLGSLLGAMLGLPLAWMAACNMALPRPLAAAAKAVLDVTRSIHTLVFALVLVGIVGLGPTAGILAIGLHSMGTYGKLFAESIESLDMGAIDAVRNVGATPLQVFFTAVWPSVLPQFVSSHLYVWEFNIRDSTILGLIGAGGLGLLISEAASLFQWGRLSTVLIVIIALVFSFDAMSRRIRQLLL
jgi:phosphonate transport system permease protein